MENQNLILESNVPNDKIDIYGNIDISTKKLPGSNEREFRILLEGNNIDHSVVNAIRRTILMSIPIYGFHRSNIHIEVEKSNHMYNNDMIYNQIEMLPIFDIPNYFDLENPELYLSNDVLKSLFSNFVLEKTEFYHDSNFNTNSSIVNSEEKSSNITDSKKKLFKIELTLSVKNNTNKDKFVSTHDAILKIDGKISNSYLDHEPISIIVLKPGEEISLRAEANLGISKMSAIYDATTNAIHKEISPTKYELVYETLGQLDKNVIFSKACIILIKKLDNLANYIKNKYEELKNDEIVEIQLFGEDHTIGNLLATALQKCSYIRKAGYCMPHPFIEKIIISYQLNDQADKGPIKVLIDVIEYLIRIFQVIGNNTFKKTN
ncbi:MAG: RpoL/Rpb11 RNA polymerase subunit family protein [Thermoplasmata archaeon]